MKTAPPSPTPDHGQAMKEFQELPEETKRMLELKKQSEKATGTTSVEIQEKIDKGSHPE